MGNMINDNPPLKGEADDPSDDRFDFWPFSRWRLTKREWNKFKGELMARLKAASDVLDEINTQLDTNTQAIADLVAEDAVVLQMVTDLVAAGAGNVTDAQLKALQAKVSGQTDSLGAVKTGLDAAVAAGQQPVTP